MLTLTKLKNFNCHNRFVNFCNHFNRALRKIFLFRRALNMTKLSDSFVEHFKSYKMLHFQTPLQWNYKPLKNVVLKNQTFIIDPNSPFYENWPMTARPLATSRPSIPSGRVYQFGPPPVLEPLPPLLPHRIQQHQDFADLDTSLDTPPGNFNGRPTLLVHCLY